MNCLCDLWTIFIDTHRTWRKNHPLSPNLRLKKLVSTKQLKQAIDSDEWKFSDIGNSFEQDYKQRSSAYVKSSEFLQTPPFIIKITDLIPYNDAWRFENIPLQSITRQTQLCKDLCNNYSLNSKQTIRNIFIPLNLLPNINNHTTNKASIIICTDHKPIGMLLFDFIQDNVQKMTHRGTPNTEITCLRIHVCGRGRFYQSFSLKNTVYKDWCEIGELRQLPEQMLNLTKESLFYNRQIKQHQLGYAALPAELWKNNDLSENNHGGGLVSSPSATYFCGWCKIPKNTRLAAPTPENRKFEARTFQHCMDMAANVVPDQKEFQSTFGVKRTPLYNASPLQSIVPILHIYLGIGSFVIHACRSVIVTDPIAHSQVLKLYDMELQKLIKKTQIDSVRHVIDWLSGKTDSMYEQSEHVAPMDKMDRKDETEMYIIPDDSVVSSDTEDEQIEAQTKEKDLLLRKFVQLKQLKQELNELNDIINGLHEEISNNNQSQEYMQFLVKFKLNIQAHWGGSIQGRTIKNLIENREEIGKLIASKDMEAGQYIQHLLHDLWFMGQILWKKNYFKFSEMLLYELKSCVINFENVWYHFVHNTKYGANIDGSTTVKLHLLYHAVEWCYFRSLSPAWMDDQRIESMNKLYKEYYQLFNSFWNENQLTKLVNYMLIIQWIQWDDTNTYMIEPE